MRSRLRRIRARLTRKSQPSTPSNAAGDTAEASKAALLRQIQDQVQQTASATRTVSNQAGLQAAERVALLQALDHLHEAQLALASDHQPQPSAAGSHPLSQRRQVAYVTSIGLGSTVLLVFGTLRIWGVREGVLYGVRPVQLVTATAVAGLVVAITGWSELWSA